MEDMLRMITVRDIQSVHTCIFCRQQVLISSSYLSYCLLLTKSVYCSMSIIIFVHACGIAFSIHFCNHGDIEIGLKRF